MAVAPMYDVRFKKFPRLRADLAKFAVLLTYLLHPWETHEERVE